jgi:hypothetical protein
MFLSLQREGGEVAGVGGIRTGAERGVGERGTGVRPSRRSGKQLADVPGVSTLGGDGIGEASRELGISHRGGSGIIGLGAGGEAAVTERESPL